MKTLQALCLNGPENGETRTVLDSVIKDGGTRYADQSRPGAFGWYGCIQGIDGKWFRNKKGQLILIWCGWISEGVE